jgi:hypothetical protein
VTTTTDDIFGMLDLQPGDGRMHKGQVFAMTWASAEMLADEAARGSGLVMLKEIATRSMTEACAASDLTLLPETIRQYAAVTHSWNPGAGLDANDELIVDDEGDAKPVLRPIRHSIHGRPIEFAPRADEDAPVHMVEIYWLAETK